MSTVLVTGGSGFIGGHAIVQLLAAGHEVRTTLRSPSREAEVRAMLAEGGAPPDAPVSFVAADLMQDAGWREAAAGCDYALHVASPLPAGAVTSDDELVIPAREGTLRVLRAARDAGVKRVVLTSSFAAIGYGHPAHVGPFDETTWSDPTRPEVQPYMRSKTLAERAAWDFIAREGGGLELAAINPTGVFGPSLGPDLSASLALVKAMMDGAMPGVARVSFGVVDVRDVVDLHLRAMTHPAARGERFIAVSGRFLWMAEMARMLREGMGPAGRRVPRLELPNLLVRVAALFSPMARMSLAALGVARDAGSDKAIHLLGWAPRPPQEALVASARSLARFGLLKA